MSRIFLLGYMASGKTTVGKQLADKMNFHFIDLDDEIEKREQFAIKKIFEIKGEKYFRSVEADVLRNFSYPENCIVATGGGTPCFSGNMDWMLQHGITMYLKVNPEILFDRLKKEKFRPLLKNKSDDELKKFIVAHIKEREEFYLRSSIVFDEENIDAVHLAKTISDFISQNK